MSMSFTRSSDHLQSHRDLSPRSIIKNRTPSCMIITFLSILSISLLIAVIAVASKRRAVVIEFVEKDKLVTVCRGAECQRFASDLSKIMDTSFDPCDNFYNYTCGNWSQVYPVDNNEIAATSPPLLLQASVSNTLSNLLSLVETKTINSPQEIAGLIYQSCIKNFQSNLEDDVKKLIDTFGGWPLSGLAPKNELTVTNIIEDNLKALTEFNLKIILDFSVYFNPFQKDSFILGVLNRNGLRASQSISYALPKIDFNPIKLNYAAGDAINKKIRSIICTLYTNCASLNNLDNEIEEMLQLELKLATLKQQSSFEFQRRFKSRSGSFYSAEDGPITVDQMDQVAPLPANLKWIDVMKKVLSVTVVDEKFRVLCDGKHVNRVMKALSESSPRVVKNWFILKVLLSLGPRFSDLFRKVFTPVADIDDYCADQVNWLMPYATADIYDTYYWRHQEGQKIEKVKEMVSELKKVIASQFQTSEWIIRDPKAKEILLSKLELMKVHVGFPDWIKDPKQLADYYKPKIESSSSYLAISRELLRLNWQRDVQRLNEPYKPDYYWYEPNMLQVNAWYYPNDNSITIPMGILDYPIFPHEIQPKSVVFGMLGFLVAHEIFHGFFPTSMQFDGNGQLINLEKEVSPQFLTDYLNVLECIQNQYDKATGKGKLTLSEDFPDNAATQILHQAYVSKDSQLFYDDFLPDQEMTKEQLFYVSFASFFCEAMSPKYAELLANNEHSPDKQRVMIPLRSSETFAKVFNCPRGSNMNPPNKCKIF